MGYLFHYDYKTKVQTKQELSTCYVNIILDI